MGAAEYQEKNTGRRENGQLHRSRESWGGNQGRTSNTWKLDQWRNSVHIKEQRAPKRIWELKTNIPHANHIQNMDRGDRQITH